MRLPWGGAGPDRWREKGHPGAGRAHPPTRIDAPLLLDAAFSRTVGAGLTAARGDPRKVHTGFAEALQRVWSEIQMALEGTPGRLLCTGHSLGAALATLAAARRPGSELFTYGSPRVGDADFVAALEGRVEVERYVNCCDLVTRVPPRPYRHVGRRIYIDHEGHNHADLSRARLAADRLEGAGGYLLKYAWRTGNVVTRDLADHAPINFVSALRAG